MTTSLAAAPGTRTSRASRRTRLAAPLVASDLVALTGAAIACPGAVTADGPGATVVQAEKRSP